jgi:hypothetical protein
VRNVADENIAAQGVHLGVALETKIIIALDEHLVGNRAVRLMTNDAAFTQGFVLVNDHARLFAMALCARFIQPRQPGCCPRPKGRPMRGFENIHPVRVVALDAVHPVFQHRMMVRQSELGMHMDMTTEAGLRFPARIDNEFSTSAPHLHMQAARSVAGFATGRLGPGRTFEMEPRMRAGWEDPGQVRVAIDAGVVADVSRSFNHGRSHDSTLDVRTGSQNTARQPHACHYDGGQNATDLHVIIPIFFAGYPAGKPCLEAGIA